MKITIEVGLMTVPKLQLVDVKPSPEKRSDHLDSTGTMELTALTQNKNLLLISIDALRYDRLQSNLMPNLTALADTSMRFARAFTPGASTLYSFPTIMSGCCLRNYSPPLAAHLSASGYMTIGILQQSPLEQVKLKQNVDLSDGFEDMFVYRDVKADVDLNRWGWGVGELTSRKLTDLCLNALDLIDHRPFFIWVHYFDLHQWSAITPAEMKTICQDPDLIADSLNYKRYDVITRYIDSEISRLLSAISGKSLDQDTIVCLISDHGEGLGERDISHHTKFVYNSLTHVPYIVHIPGTTDREYDQPVSVASLTPTLVELLTGKKGYYCSANSLVPFLADQNTSTKKSVLFIRDYEQSAIIDSPWKLIFTPRYGVFERYHLLDDPSEENNVFGDNYELDTRLIQNLIQNYSLCEPVNSFN